MDDKLKKSLRTFLNNNKRNRIENDGVAVWNEVLTDLPFFDGKQPRVSFAFTRYQENHVDQTILSDILKDGREQTIGMVVAIPSFWLNCDPYLTSCYVEYWVDEFVQKYFVKKKENPYPPHENCPIQPPPKPHHPKPKPPQPDNHGPFIPGTGGPHGNFPPPPPPQPQPPMSPPRPGGVPSDFNRV